MARLAIRFTREDEDGEEVEVVLPAKYVICDECSGAGRHTNRNIDGNGITSSEWAEWDEDERETYLSGGYDVPCEGEGCQDGKVLVVDEAAVSPADADAYEDYKAERAYARRESYEDAYTRRMESGGGGW